MNKNESLFKTKTVPGKPGSGKIFEEEFVHEDGPVTCLGKEFKNDQARREYFTELLGQKLKDPDFRKIEGFPIGEDEDILALSDPPYYTACPNPWTSDFIAEWEAQKPIEPEGYQYHREPFAADVSEGKNDPIYNAHSYHTKVPHKAIMRYILHYTEPGDIVFDGFCGTGMTGVAAQMCGDRDVIQSLGYQVKTDGTILQEETDENGKKAWRPFSKLGVRRAILNDLSPTAGFIAGAYNTTHDPNHMKSDYKKVMSLKSEIEQAYRVSRNGKLHNINYVVWSDFILCNNCGGELCTFDAAIDREEGKINGEYACPHCGAETKKSTASKSMESYFDNLIGEVHSIEKRKPKFASIFYGRTKKLEPWREEDDASINYAESLRLGRHAPVVKLPYMHMTHERNTLPDQGITYVHHFYSKRNFIVLSRILEKISCNHSKLVFTSFCDRHAVLRNRWLLTGPTRPLNNTLYVPPLMTEVNPFLIFEVKYKNIANALRIIKAKPGSATIGNQSSANLNKIPDESLDYIFVDPPFGGNILYSDLNIVWESWLGVRENIIDEAVIDKVQGKGLGEYHELIKSCFSEFYRKLKPGRWMTLEFHSSKSSVWTAIQEALRVSGFVIADTKTLDKKQGTIHQDSKPSSVKQDLIITAYKPDKSLVEKFQKSIGTDRGVWEFTRHHLANLSIFIEKNGRACIIPERQNFLLFDRMVAFYVQKGVAVSMSASDYYSGLSQRFSEREGMYFLPEQAEKYDRKRIKIREFTQIKIFVVDEASAIHWLRQQLYEKPQKLQDIHPNFMQQLGGWSKNEAQFDLRELLNQNFICYDGKGPVPEQIHAYLSTNWKELRNLPKDDRALVTKARDRWYVPNPNKAGDLEKLREKALFKEFEEYKNVKKKLKVFRLEAVRAGFKKAWQEKNYPIIVAVAEKIPNNVLEEDPKLLMWYNLAVTRTEDSGGGL